MSKKNKRKRNKKRSLQHQKQIMETKRRRSEEALLEKRVKDSTRKQISGLEHIAESIEWDFDSF